MRAFWRDRQVKKKTVDKKSPYIFIGLGNPGTKYLSTRHNSGFLAIDYFADKYNIKIKKIKCKSVLGEKTIYGERVILAKPQTFMNRSGESFRELVGSYKADLSRVIVIYDDVDIDPGVIRIRKKGSSGTHNGMRDIIYKQKNDEFPRIRIGIGKPEGRMDLADYVLSPFSSNEKKIIFNTLGNVAESMEAIIKDGIDTAMNRYNK